MTAVFLLPQNFFLLYIIVKARNFDLFDKILILNILIFFLLHLNTLMYAEYLTPIIPLLIILAVKKWDVFIEKSNLFKKYSQDKKIKILTAIYIVFIPFGITYLKVPFEGGTFMFNPITMNSFLNEVNKLDGKSILSGWEGYSVYSDKIPIAPDQYQGFFLQDVYSSVPEVLKKTMLTREDYRNIITNRNADIIIYEPGNPVHLKGMVNDIEAKYVKQFERDGLIVYLKK
jgi:hypothetical protein